MFPSHWKLHDYLAYHSKCCSCIFFCTFIGLGFSLKDCLMHVLNEIRECPLSLEYILSYQHTLLTVPIGYTDFCVGHPETVHSYPISSTSFEIPCLFTIRPNSGLFLKKTRRK